MSIGSVHHSYFDASLVNREVSHPSCLSARFTGLALYRTSRNHVRTVRGITLAQRAKKNRTGLNPRI